MAKLPTKLHSEKQMHCSTHALRHSVDVNRDHRLDASRRLSANCSITLLSHYYYFSYALGPILLPCHVAHTLQAAFNTPSVSLCRHAASPFLCRQLSALSIGARHPLFDATSRPTSVLIVTAMHSCCQGVL